MLKKNQRLTRSDVTTLFSAGKVIHSPHFAMRATDKDASGLFSAAFILSKKVEKKAPLRNKARRRCYHALRKISHEYKKPFKAVFVIKKKIDSLSFGELEQEIRDLCRKMRLI